MAFLGEGERVHQFKHVDVGSPLRTVGRTSTHTVHTGRRFDLLLYAVDVVARDTVDFSFDEAMYIALKTRQLLIEFTYKLQVINNRFIEALTRDQ
jgi:hypothetical protein